MPDYTAYGLTIRSDYQLPPLRAVSTHPDINGIDVIVKRGKVSPTGLPKPNVSTSYYQAAPNELWLNIEGVARFHVSGDGWVIVDADEVADEQTIRLFLLGSCLGAILHLRNQLVIHGNAIRFGDSCVVFAGDSGHGKSTLAAALHQHGYEVLADDLAVIDERYHVHSGYPQIKLWEDSAEKLGIEVSTLKKILYQESKYAYPLNDGFCEIALPLRDIYLLEIHDQPGFVFEALKGFEKFIPLKDNTYRIEYLEGFGLKQSHLKRCSELANRTRVTRILRPDKDFKISQLIDEVEKHLGIK